MIVQMGTCPLPLEEYAEAAEEKNLMMKEDLEMLQDMPSVPFQISFDIPVVKVTCGDGFSTLLSAEG